MDEINTPTTLHPQETKIIKDGTDPFLTQQGVGETPLVGIKVPDVENLDSKIIPNEELPPLSHAEVAERSIVKRMGDVGYEIHATEPSPSDIPRLVDDEPDTIQAQQSSPEPIGERAPINARQILKKYM